MLGLIPNDVDTKCRKWCIDARDIATVSRHLADKREQHMGEDKNSVAEGDINLDVPHDNEEEIPNIVWEHERMWSGQFG